MCWGGRSQRAFHLLGVGQTEMPAVGGGRWDEEQGNIRRKGKSGRSCSCTYPASVAPKSKPGIKFEAVWLCAGLCGQL